MKVTLDLTEIQTITLSDVRLAASIAASQAEREAAAYKTAMALVLDAHGHKPLSAQVISLDQGTKTLVVELPDEKEDGSDG